jgi:alpha-ribazole phosphatase
MVTTLYLIRHGATDGSGTKRYIGHIDVPLSERGKDQMKKTATFISAHLADSPTERSISYLKDIHSSKAGKLNSLDACRLSAVYCSDLVRAVTSADILAQPHGLVPIEVPALRERSFGVWEGMTFLEIKGKYPVEFELWAENPLEFSPMGGESTTGVKERVIPEVEGIIKKHAGQSVAVVAHGGINRIVLCHILGMPLENIFRIEQDYAAVNIIEFWEKYPVVKLINGTGTAAFRGDREVSEGK